MSQAPPAQTGFVPPPYQWTGNVVDGDILAAVALFFFPLLTFYGRKQFVTSITAGSCIAIAYTTYCVSTALQHAEITDRSPPQSERTRLTSCDAVVVCCDGAVVLLRCCGCAAAGLLRAPDAGDGVHHRGSGRRRYLHRGAGCDRPGCLRAGRVSRRSHGQPRPALRPCPRRSVATSTATVSSRLADRPLTLCRPVRAVCCAAADLITHEFLFRLLFLLIPGVGLGLLTLWLINFLIRPVSAFVGAYLLAASLSRLLARLGLSASAPLDPPVFFGPLDLTSPNPTPAFTVSLLLSYALVVLWLAVALAGVVAMYHSEFAYTEIERIHVDGKEYRRVNMQQRDPRAATGQERFGLSSSNGGADVGGYHGAYSRNVIQDL